MSYEFGVDSRFFRERADGHYSTTADYHIYPEHHYFQMLETANALYRDDLLVKAAIERLSSYVIGDGFTLDPLTGSKYLDEYLFAEWEVYTNNKEFVDVQKKANWVALQTAAFEAVIRDGDLFVKPTVSGHLEHIEGSRCRTPSPYNPTKPIFLGVEQTKQRETIAYHFCQDVIAPWYLSPLATETERVPARDAQGRAQVFHIFNPIRRSTLSRGVTALHPCGKAAGMLDDLQIAKLIQQQLAAYVQYIRKRGMTPDGEPTPTINPSASASTRLERTPTGKAKWIKDAAPGAVLDVGYDEVTPWTPDIPGDNFFEHVNMFVTYLGINLGVPLILLLMDASETNFSGWRGAFDVAKNAFRRMQSWFSDVYHKDIYQWWVLWKLGQELQAGLNTPLTRSIERSSLKLLNHKWNHHAWPYIEPLNDSKAFVLRRESMQSSPRRLHAEQGDDFGTILEETLEDNTLLITSAIQRASVINAQLPQGVEPVHWREVLGQQFPKAVAAQDKRNREGGKL